MARARLGLEKAINEILERQGVDGKRLSFRQAERRTGLSPATISELAKGNARTPETLRRFAQGLNEDVSRLMLLAGFVPEDDTSAAPLTPENHPSSCASSLSTASPAGYELDADERAWLLRLEHALTRLTPGPDRVLWKGYLAHSVELLERFAEHKERDQRKDHQFQA